jgi:hypothetical protein
MVKKRKWIFAVHKWESSGGRHEVTVGTGNRYQTKKFNKWENAERYAARKARERGQRSYQIDTPKNPHTMIHLVGKGSRTKRRRR